MRKYLRILHKTISEVTIYERKGISGKREDSCGGDNGAVECAHSEAMKITPTWGGERVQSAVRRDRQEAAVLRYTELKADINSRIARLFEIKRELFELVDEIEDPRIRTLIVSLFKPHDV